MKKTILKSAVLAIAGVGLLAGNALALSISLDDGNDGVDIFTVLDGDGNDTFGLVEGVVGYAGTIGNWDLNTTIGTSHPALGTMTKPELDLFSLTLEFPAQISPAASGIIAISATDTYANFSDLESIISGFTASIGGTTPGEVDFFANVNGVNLQIDWADMLHTGNAFAGSTSMSLADYAFAADDVWDMTLTAIVSQGVGITTLDANVAAPVPEPATMLLFGTGLAGLAGVARRKKARKES